MFLVSTVVPAYGIHTFCQMNVTGPNRRGKSGGLAWKQGGMWEIGRVSMKTRRYVGEREVKITTEYEKLLSLLCFVNEFPKTKRKKYPQYTSE